MECKQCWCGEQAFSPFAAPVINRFKRSKDRYQVHIVRCRRCGTVRMLDNGLEGDPVYEDNYLYESISHRHRHTARLIADHAKSGTLLDVGASTGILLEAIREVESPISSLRGIDLDSKAIAHGVDKYGLDLEALPIQEETGTYDNIVMAHTLEHIQDLSGFLNATDRVLKPGGRLFIAVPNIEALATRLLLNLWPALRPDEHVWYFDQHTLAACFRQILPTYKIVHAGSYFIWKPRWIPGMVWKGLLSENKKQRMAENYKGDQLEMIFEKAGPG